MVRKYSVCSLLFIVLCLVDSCIIVCGMVMWVMVIICMNLNGFSLVVLCSGVLVICISWLIGIEFGCVGRLVSVSSRLVWCLWDLFMLIMLL